MSAAHLVSVLIPVKKLEDGKSRLSETLSPSQRIEITEDVLRRMLRILRAISEIDEIVVVTRDDDVESWMHGRRVRVMRERGADLNESLRHARDDLTANALLVLPADLVALSELDAREMIALSESRERCVVIAPDRRESGTNALLLKPPSAIDFAFGEGSANTHAQLAREVDVEVVWYRSETISLDLDLPEDLDWYAQQW
jgi:2-phospho-L-lactate guanylyltransferase